MFGFPLTTFRLSQPIRSEHRSYSFGKFVQSDVRHISKTNPAEPRGRSRAVLLQLLIYRRQPARSSACYCRCSLPTGSRYWCITADQITRTPWLRRKLINIPPVFTLTILCGTGPARHDSARPGPARDRAALVIHLKQFKHVFKPAADLK